MKKFFRSWFFIFLAILTFGIALEKIDAALYSTQNLELYQNNMDILGDKEGNLLQLIGELQSYRIEVTSGSAANTNIILRGFTSSETVVSLQAISSGCVALASTSTTVQFGAPAACEGRGSVFLRSRLMGLDGNNIRVNFTQMSSAPYINWGTSVTYPGGLVPGALSVVTTGYNIEVKLSTGDDGAWYSSSTMVAAAINGNVAAHRMLYAYEVSPSSAIVLSLLSVSPNGGLGTALSVPRIIPTSYVVSFGTTANTVQLSTGCPVVATDALIWGILKKPK